MFFGQYFCGFSNCKCFLLVTIGFQRLVFDLSKLLRIWSFAFAIPPAFYLGFKLAFAFSSSAQTVCFQLWFFAYHFAPSLFLRLVDFLAVYKLFQHTTFCFGIYALHIRIFAVTDCIFLSRKGLPVHWYHLFVDI